MKLKKDYAIYSYRTLIKIITTKFDSTDFTTSEWKVLGQFIVYDLSYELLVVNFKEKIVVSTFKKLANKGFTEYLKNYRDIKEQWVAYKDGKLKEYYYKHNNDC